MRYYTEVIDGTTRYYRDDELKIMHREDGPAVERADGTKIWYINGNCHRADGPACEYVTGGKVWYFNGMMHREDGPAIEYADGSADWYLNGKRVSEDDFKTRTAPCTGKVVDGVKYVLTAA